MNEEAVHRLYTKIRNALEIETYDVAMIAVGMVHNELAIQHTKDEHKLQKLYTMMGDAAICLARCCNDDGNHQLQAEKNSPQKTQRAKARKKAGNESGPFGAH